MAKVLVAFYNGVSDEKNPSAMPVFYEAFIQGLDRAGNQVMVYSHAAFGIDFGEIDIQTRDSILNFEPDLCIVFNNCFYDLAEVQLLSMKWIVRDILAIRKILEEIQSVICILYFKKIVGQY